MNKKNSFLVLAVLAFLLSGCSEPIMQSDETGTELTLEEIAKHNSAEDCWIVLSGKVYNVTNFISEHPGGKAILEGCGKDATEFFETRPMGSGTAHSQRARTLRENYYLGDLED